MAELEWRLVMSPAAGPMWDVTSGRLSTPLPRPIPKSWPPQWGPARSLSVFSLLPLIRLQSRILVVGPFSALESPPGLDRSTLLQAG